MLKGNFGTPSLHIHTQYILDDQTYCEGEYRHTQADAGHFSKTAFEGQVFGDGNVVVKRGDDNDNGSQHGDQGPDPRLGREDQIGQNQQRDGDQIGDTCVYTCLLYTSRCV